jgi:hypothetical protein
MLVLLLGLGAVWIWEVLVTHSGLKMEAAYISETKTVYN